MDYHTRSQQFIKSSKEKGMTVKAEGEELIAYPKGWTKPKRYADKVVDTITRPVSRKVHLYTTPDYEQKKKDEKNPKSPRYKKNFIDKTVDKILER